MINLDAVKITPRDEEVLKLLAQGCSNKEIAGTLNISPRTVKQHLRPLFLRAGITDGAQARKVGHRRICQGADGVMQPRDQLTAKEIQVTTLVWEGLTNREIAKIVGTREQVVKNYLRTAFDKLGVWSRLELALLCRQPWGRRLGCAAQFGDGIEPFSERFGASTFSRTIAPGEAPPKGVLSPSLFRWLSSSTARCLRSRFETALRNTVSGAQKDNLTRRRRTRRPATSQIGCKLLHSKTFGLEALWSGIISLTVNYLVLAGGH
jgi:DNA-binding CsgD family transcriptional regulator